MATVKFSPEHTGMFNILQEKLIARCIRKDLPIVGILEQLKLQKSVASKLEDYPEFFTRDIFKKSVMV